MSREAPAAPARFSVTDGTGPGTRLGTTGDRCARIGAATDAVHVGNHAAGRAFAGAIHAEHADVEGFLYGSRLTGEEVIAVFDCGTGKLESSETGRLMDHPELPGVLERHGIGLVV